MEIYDYRINLGDKSIHDDYVYIGQSGSGDIEIPLTGKQIKSICTQGDNEENVIQVCKSPLVRDVLRKYTDVQVHDALVEYGDWDEEELKDRRANEICLIWLLSWDISDSENPNDFLAVNSL